LISTKYKIVLVSFPFDDQSTSKVRPAVCLTEPISLHNQVITALISIQIQKSNEKSNIILRTTQPDFSSTGLRVDSVIRLHRVATIPINIIKRELGFLPENYINILKTKLRHLFEI